MGFRKKKSRKFRGEQTHGYGAKKKHRGAGNRGGRGRAGSGKRADQKKPSYQKVGKHYLGKHGFKSKNTIKIVAINIRDLEVLIPTFVAQKLAKKIGDMYSINLEDIGYNKLLGAGKTTIKMEIKTVYASKSAIEKINTSGGKIEVSNPTEDSSDKE